MPELTSDAADRRYSELFELLSGRLTERADRDLLHDLDFVVGARLNIERHNDDRYKGLRAIQAMTEELLA